MNRDERIITLAEHALENAGHKNIAVRPVKYGEGGPGAADKSESAGTWSLSSDRGAFSFSLTWDEYQQASDEQIKTVILGCLT